MARISTFENLGKDISTAKGIEDALTLAGLNYDVEGKPLFYEFNNFATKVPGMMTTVRMDTGASLGVVAEKYGIVQNRDAFGFVDYIDMPISFVKGGETKGGMVYIICKIDDINILGDSFTPYILFRNSFNGAYSLDACICPLRIVCQNQFAASFRETENTIHLKHSKNVADRWKEAQYVIAGVLQYLETLKKQAEKYAGIKVSKGDVFGIIDSLFPIKDGMSDRQKDVITLKKTEFISAYNADDNWAFRGTAWGIINAATDFYTHETPIRQTATAEENKFISVTFDPRIMGKVLTLINTRVSA